MLISQIAAPAETVTTETPVAKTITTAEEPASSTSDDLTPEQKALKARAERFGLPFDPKALTSKTTPPPPTANATPAPAASSNGAASSSAPAAPTTEKKERPGAIDKDKSSLGLSDEVLARRAAKFGLPEKKVEAPKEQKVVAKEAAAAKPVSKKEAEVTPYVESVPFQ